jgi:UDP-glucose 4-epimerase
MDNKPGNASVLVTGVAGFIGSHVAAHALKLGVRVTGVDDLSGGFLSNVPEGTDFVQASVMDHDAVSDIWRKHGPFDYVYHLAAYAAEGLSHFIRRFNYQNNVTGSVNIINECLRHQVKCLVFTSSIAVYGVNQLPMTEDLTPSPEDPYGIGKYAVELDLAAARRLFGLNSIIFRPHNVYGEGQNIGDPYRNVIGIFMNQVMRGQQMTIFGDGMQTRAFSYIDDVAPVIARGPFEPSVYNQVFNIGADKPYSVLELAQTVCKCFGVEPNIKFLPARKEVEHAFADHSRVRAAFGLGDPTPLDVGVARMADWAKKTGPKSPTPFSAIEVDRELPPSWRALMMATK